MLCISHNCNMQSRVLLLRSSVLSPASAAFCRSRLRTRQARLIAHFSIDQMDEVLPQEAKGCIYDLDGTLLASNRHRVDSWAKACEKHGLKIDRDKYMVETGKSGKDIVAQLCKEQGVDLNEEDRQALVKQESEIFIQQGMKHSKPIPAVIDVAKAAKERGLPMAVASGGQEEIVKQAMEEYGLKDLFSVVVTSKDVEHAKPEPDIFRMAAERLGVPIGKCVVFEDAQQGMEAAERAGVLKVIDVKTFPGHPDKDLVDDRRG